MMKSYLVICERGGEDEENWGAYVPDLPGCITTGETLAEVKERIREAVALQLEGMRAERLPVREPTTVADQVAVAA